MSILRAERPEKYAVISNKILDNKRLSWAARGLLSHLLSKPDNWKVMVAALINETQDSEAPSGRDAVRTLLKELITAGYVRKIESRGEHGRMAGVDYVVMDSPRPGNPSAVEPPAVDHPLVSTEKAVNTQKAENPLIECFDLFWFAGMRKIGKVKALAAFKKAAKNADMDLQGFSRMLSKDVANRVGKQMGFDQMHPATYLNGQRWNDESPSAINAPAVPAKQYDNWSKSESGIVRKCGELGIRIGARSYNELRDLCWGEIRKGQQ